MTPRPNIKKPHPLDQMDVDQIGLQPGWRTHQRMRAALGPPTRLHNPLPPWVLAIVACSACALLLLGLATWLCH